MTKEELKKFIETLHDVKNQLQDAMDDVNDLALELEVEAEEDVT